MSRVRWGALAAGALFGEFPASVIAEAAKFKPGDRMWVIYRMTDASDKAVTALGFPGVESQPVYINANPVNRSGAGRIVLAQCFS